MSIKIIRNHLDKMNTEAVVNIVDKQLKVEDCSDLDIYKAAGNDQLLEYIKNHKKYVSEREAFITPGFDLNAKYIIHVASRLYWEDKADEEKTLRECYGKALQLAKEYEISSITVPLFWASGVKFSKEESLRIAIDEFSHFLHTQEMDIYLIVGDSNTAKDYEKNLRDLPEYIENNYIDESSLIEADDTIDFVEKFADQQMLQSITSCLPLSSDDYEYHESKLEERMEHLSDSFSEYLMYLISVKGLDNVAVYKRAIVDKKIFSKIKNNKNYHPQKLTILCLCIGAELNIDETTDLLARAGYALSPCDKTDIIFQYFIENKIYDMIELDIQLEEYGLPCIIQ